MDKTFYMEAKMTFFYALVINYGAADILLRNAPADANVLRKLQSMHKRFARCRSPLRRTAADLMCQHRQVVWINTAKATARNPKYRRVKWVLQLK